MAYPNLTSDPEAIKIKNRDDDTKELIHKTVEHDYEVFLKLPKIDKGYYKNKIKKLNEKETTLVLSDNSIGSSSTLMFSALSFVKLSVGFPITSSSASKTSIAILITSECISKMKIRYTEIGDWIDVYSLLQEKILKQSMIDKKIDHKGGQEFKKVI